MAKKKTAKKRGKSARTAHSKKERFLSAYEKFGNVCTAAKVAGIGRRTHYDWLADDQSYAAQFEDAQQQANAAIEEAMRKRAIDGWEEPVWHKGKQCGVVRKFDSTLLIVLAKANMPEKYRENHKVEMSGKVDIHKFLTSLTPDQMIELGETLMGDDADDADE